MICWKMIMVAMILSAASSALALQSEMLCPPGKTPQERIEFLTDLEKDEHIPKEEVIPYYLGALEDQSAEVREYAAYSSRGEVYLPKLIQVMATDRDFKVRRSAALGISHWITDNGAEDCNSVVLIVKHLDQFLIGLKDDSTAQWVLEVLGGGYAGDTPLPCCMPNREKQLVIEHLKVLKDYPPNHSIGTYWSTSLVLEALENIEECTKNDK